MTREEEIKLNARWRADQYDHPAKWSDTYYGFINGAEWADAHPVVKVGGALKNYKRGYEDAIDKACEWLYEYNRKQTDKMFGTVRTADVTINVAQFRKAMKSGCSEIPNNCEKGEEDEDHFIDANKKVDRVIGTADHIKTALDVLNKKGGKK